MLSMHRIDGWWLRKIGTIAVDKWLGSHVKEQTDVHWNCCSGSYGQCDCFAPWKYSTITRMSQATLTSKCSRTERAETVVIISNLSLFGRMWKWQGKREKRSSEEFWQGFFNAQSLDIQSNKIHPHGLNNYNAQFSEHSHNPGKAESIESFFTSQNIGQASNLRW